jgi:hypothetical protein
MVHCSFSILRLRWIQIKEAIHTCLSSYYSSTPACMHVVSKAAFHDGMNSICLSSTARRLHCFSCMVPISLLLERYITEYICTIGNSITIPSAHLKWSISSSFLKKSIPRKILPSMSVRLLLKLFSYALIGYASHVFLTSKDSHLAVRPNQA